MSETKLPIVVLSDLEDGQEADLFVLMSKKEELTTRDGKPYWRVGFRDGRREVLFPIWADSKWADACRQSWGVGVFYKIRGIYRETRYGPQLDIHKIREVTDRDRDDGFDPLMLQPQSRFDPPEMFDELLTLARERIADNATRNLVSGILTEHRDELLTLPAASRNHHAFAGGFLEHVLNVARTSAHLADRYAEHYPDMQPPLDKDLVIAGGILHDIGKLHELAWQPEGASYTAPGRLLGHIVQGRDIVRQAAAELQPPIDPQRLLRLEHVILSHQRLPEWGSPKPPMTPEALLVHFADEIDAKFQMVYQALAEDRGGGEFTTSRNPLGLSVYRGPATDAAAEQQGDP